MKQIDRSKNKTDLLVATGSAMCLVALAAAIYLVLETANCYSAHSHDIKFNLSVGCQNLSIRRDNIGIPLAVAAMICGMICCIRYKAATRWLSVTSHIVAGISALFIGICMFYLVVFGLASL